MRTHPRTRRARGSEHLDASSPDPTLAAAEFRYLRRLNRATTAAEALLDATERRLSPAAGQEISFLDLGAGSGDIMARLLALTRGRAWRASATASDHSALALDQARAFGAAESGVALDLFDILSDAPLPAGAPFSVVHASLVIHHFADGDVVRALCCMGRCARDLVVWNDLVRDRAGVFGAWVGTLACRRALRDDAILSVRRGFTLTEARAFAEAAGLEEIEVRRWRGARFVLTGRPTRGGDAAPAARPLIRARSLGFSFGTRRVIDNRSFVLRAGEVGLAAGPNGSGKTTLLRLLAGVLRPVSGDAWADGSEGPIGYLPQRGGLIAALSVGANMDMLQRIAGIERSAREAHRRDAIARMGLEHLASHPVARLSLGQARRAAIASVLATAGSTMLLDEPDAGLDADGRERLGKAIVEHARAGGAVLVASHEWSWLERACTEARVPLARSVVE
jgi:heme exporter protein A